MSDATTAARWDVIKALAPSIGQSVVLAVTLLCTIGTTYWVTKPKVNPLPIADADSPRPVPMVAIADVDHVVSDRCGPVSTELAALRQTIEQRFPIPTPKSAPSKTKAAAR